MTSLSETQQDVYRVTKTDGYKSIKVFKEAVPKIESNEVLVRIRAVTLNYRDVVISSGNYPMTVKDQVVPGSDACGDVVQVGSK
ncbi:hypothetical protein ABG067_009051, partial [Albugo candida]